ncbi:MAG: carbohydrate kinase family protein [Thermomicrobia bacterium]|nr:carbohydrate kinase family protein [Thermomicrobia bacterium]
MHLATIGDIAVDIRAAAGEALTRGADARGAIHFLPGGSAANVAVWAARLGATATCIGAVGADPWGAWLRDDLRRENVTVIGPRRGQTATILTFLDPDGERTFVTDRAAALSLRSADLPDTLWDRLDVLHIPSYSLFEGSLAETATVAARRARARGALLSIDLSSVSLLRAYGSAAFAALLADLRPDLLFANREEAQVSFAVTSADEAANAMRALARIAVVKRGAAGILVTSEAGCIAASAPAHAVDSTGAGDALAAAFLIAYLQHHAVEQAAWAAVRLAGAVVQGEGARPPVRLR